MNGEDILNRITGAGLSLGIALVLWMTLRVVLS